MHILEELALRRDINSKAAYKTGNVNTKSSEVLFSQPAKRHMLYKVHTGSCYDSVIEANLNTGLPKKVSCITDRHTRGKKRAPKVEDPDLSYEE